MLAFPQDRVFLGFVVRFRLKNNRVIAQAELRAVLVEKLEAGSEKNNVGNARHCFSQGFECYNLSTVFNLTRLAQQGNHLLTHILAMHLVCACCSDKTVLRQSSLIHQLEFKTKVQEKALTYVCQDFCREICHFDLFTTQCPR